MVFPISSGDASTIQQHYEQVIETLLRTLLNHKSDKTAEHQDLKIFDGDRLIYGRNKNQFHDVVSGLSGQLLNPQLITQLQQMRSTSVGGVVEGATNKRVELDGEVILQSDEKGRVIVNAFLPSSVVQNESLQQVADKDDYFDNRGNSNEVDYGKFLLKENHIQEAKVQEEKQSSTTSGSQRVMQSLEVLEDSPLRRLLTTEIEQLQAEVKALQQERSLYQELINKRLQQPQNTSWWQQAINNISIVVSSVSSAVKMGIREFKEHSAQHRNATSLKTLFHAQKESSAKEYQAGKYQISREGSLYEVKESATGKILMQFRSTPLGVKIEKDDLSSIDIKQIDDLQSSLKRNESLPDVFTPLGKKEGEYFARINRITTVLQEYASLQKRDVEIDGRFSYKWQATTDGKVTIYAKDGRGMLLDKSGGQVKSFMDERDLIYFEQMLPKLQPNKSAINSQSHQVTNNSLER
ncbi:MAG: hypothetical protein QNJ47_05560 [Nostocaceae cyanobacterium]|nr:hypothetical protein [Nostocaceae cyanobacterium]